MPGLPHLVLQGTAQTEQYTYTGPIPKGPFKLPPRDDREEHGSLLREQLKEIEAEEKPKTEQEISPSGPKGVPIEFKSDPDHELKLDSLEDKKAGIRLVNVRMDEDKVMRATVFVPEGETTVFGRKIEQYITEDTKTGKPKNKNLVESISEMRRAVLPSYWTDTPDSYPNENETIWFEVWLRNDEEGFDVEQAFRDAAANIGIPVGDRHIPFPERIVLLARATLNQWYDFPGLFNVLAELRRAKIVSTDFLELPPSEQTKLINEALERIEFAGPDAAAVCLLDTGVNRGHPLLEPALHEDHHLAVDPDWSPTDHAGHGTELAGLGLYGCLTTVLGENVPIQLKHRLESVKILPAEGANDPEQYGAITTEAIARAEIASPNRSRAVCLAVTADSRDVGRPSSWSAAIDQTCAGALDDERRLVFISVGNAVIETRDDYPARNQVEGIQDPSQSWNAVTVGAYTDLAVIRSSDYADWKPVAEPGRLSPSSTTSLVWQDRRWPFKPDIVMEGGNNAINPETGDAEFIDDLALLTTRVSPTGALLATTGETSAATAQAARFAAIIQGQYPQYWPETIRALMIHTAEWTQAMLDEFPSNSQQLVHQRLRCYGYGVPSLQRALWCARNDATLIAQEALQPFDKVDSDIKTKDMHVHALPWPTDVLRDLGEEPITMRVTLSYFIEPSPGARWTRSHRYQSHGLRFDVRRPLETVDAFRMRLSKAHWDDPDERPDSAAEVREWELGPRLCTRGSIHSDTWHGKAAELADCGYIGVYPVTGWWRERKHLERWNRLARYSLIVSIRTPKTEIDLYTPIATQIGIETEIE